MTGIVIGNILTLIATIFMSYSGTRKTKEQILLVQEIAMGLFVLSGFSLKGYSGIVQNVVGMFRNIVVLYMPNDRIIGWLLVIAGIVFGVWFNNRGIIGLFPVICSIPFAVMVVKKDSDPIRLKITLIISSLGYAIYAIVNYNAVGVITNLITAGITAAALYRDIQAKRA